MTIAAQPLAEVPDPPDRSLLVNVAADVVQDYAATVCDGLDKCSCSMAQLARMFPTRRPT